MDKFKLMRLKIELILWSIICFIIAFICFVAPLFKNAQPFYSIIIVYSIGFFFVGSGYFFIYVFQEVRKADK
jgi:uncharacterized membrane protein YczE